MVAETSSLVTASSSGESAANLTSSIRAPKILPSGLRVASDEPSTGEGEFNIVHNICCDADGWVYVADRENHRVQVFDGNGKFETQWPNLHRPCGLCTPYGHQPIFYVGEVSR